MWAIAWPFLLGAWAFLFAVFTATFFGRKDAGAEVRWQPVRWGIRAVLVLAIGFGSLILVASLPTWLHIGTLHVRGVPVNATVLNWSREYDAENSRHFTRITYEFEAEADGRRRPFERQGELRGMHFQESDFVRVLHDPADPLDSRMVLEFGDARDLMLSASGFLVLGVASFLLLRRMRRTRAAAAPPRRRDGRAA